MLIDKVKSVLEGSSKFANVKCIMLIKLDASKIRYLYNVIVIDEKRI